MIKNSLKQKLQAGKTVLGMFINCPYPALIEICGQSGFDFAVIDLEHSPLDILAAENLCRAADCTGLAPIIRVRKNDTAQIQRALDIGSTGVQIPQIESQIEAETAVKSAKFAPIGYRGLSFYTRAGNYGAISNPEEINQETLVVIQVEGKAGIEQLESIVTVPHIDVIFLGPYDLSQSLGIPGQVNDTRVVELMEQAVEIIRHHGKAVGTFASNPETAQKWLDLGVQYLGISVDVMVFRQACERLVKTLKF